MNGIHISRGLTFAVRTEKEGDIAIIRENIDEDVYRLVALKASGFEPKVVVDIGACLGTFTKFAHSLWPDAQYYAFEPSPRSFELLTMNCPFAKCFNKAIGDGSKTLLTDGAEATGGGFLTTQEHFAFDEQYAKAKADGYNYSLIGEVETITFDQFVSEAKLTSIDLLKLDFEGGEYQLLRDSSERTLAMIKRLVGECHPEDWHDNVWGAFKALVAERLPHVSIETDHPTLPIASFYSV
jgi:FkbM family methyltransferase